jgi:hypothetical protein
MKADRPLQKAKVISNWEKRIIVSLRSAYSNAHVNRERREHPKHVGGSPLDSVPVLSEPTTYVPLLQKRATGDNDVLLISVGSS